MHRAFALVSSVAVVLALAPPALGVVRHVSPTGVDAVSTCTDAEPPCSLRRAIETVANAGDEVVVAAGDYSLSAPVTVSDADLFIHGAAGQARPRIVNASGATVLNAATARVSDLRLEAPGSVVSASGTGVLERLVVIAGAAGAGSAVTLIDGGMLRDSVVHTVATGGHAVYVGRRTSRLVNVTAVATDAAGIGLYAEAPVGGICVPPFSTEAYATNSILRGGLYDVSVPDLCNNGTQLVVLATSNFRRTKLNQGPPEARIEEAGGNQEAEPIFASPPSLDFHQLAGSQTIDAGAGGSLLGAADIDGEARAQGAAPDIGADEYVPPAPQPPPPPPGPMPDTRRPVASLLALSPSSFRPAGRGGSVAQRRARRGTTVSYALDEAAIATFRIRRAVQRRGRTRYVTLRGSFSHAGAVGGNRFRFTGRLRRRALKPGLYRLVGTPRDGAGNAGSAVRASFRVRG